MSRTFRHSFRVRYAECDPQGVVFNANYLAFFDLVMTELWRETLGGYQAMVDAGTDMVVVEATVRFLAGAGFDDQLDFEASIAKLGNTSMSTRISASRGGEPIVEGEIHHVFINAQTKEKVGIPDPVRTALEPYLAAVTGTSA